VELPVVAVRVVLLVQVEQLEVPVLLVLLEHMAHQELQGRPVLQAHLERQGVAAPPGHRAVVRCLGGTVIDILLVRKQTT